MCISKAAELLSKWFETHDSFRMWKDYKNLDWTSVDDDEGTSETEQKAAIVLALKELEKEKALGGYFSGKDEESEGVWVLMNSQKDSPVQIQVSKQTCENISTVVNGFLPSLDLSINEKSNPKNIGEADIIILLSVIHSLANKIQSEESKKKKQ